MSLTILNGVSGTITWFDYREAEPVDILAQIDRRLCVDFEQQLCKLFAKRPSDHYGFFFDSGVPQLGMGTVFFFFHDDRLIVSRSFEING